MSFNVDVSLGTNFEYRACDWRSSGQGDHSRRQGYLPTTYLPVQTDNTSQIYLFTTLHMHPIPNPTTLGSLTNSVRWRGF